jgi:hypothetical protein
LHALLGQLKCSFGFSFQLQAFWANGILAPSEIVQLLPAMLSMREELGEKALLKALQRLVLQLTPTDASSDPARSGVEGFRAALRQHASFLPGEDDYVVDTRRDEILIYRVTVTPTGTHLSGPEITAANRVLRQYRQHSEHFLRVSFGDELEDRLDFH